MFPMQAFALPCLCVITLAAHFRKSACFSFKVLPVRRDFCGLSWFWISFPHFQTWNRSVKKKDLVIHSLTYWGIVLSCMAKAGLQHWVPPAPFRLQPRSGSRYLFTFLRWDPRLMATSDSKGGWGRECVWLAMCVRLQFSCHGRRGEWIGMDSLHYARYFYAVLTWGGKQIFKFIITLCAGHCFKVETTRMSKICLHVCHNTAVNSRLLTVSR